MYTHQSIPFLNASKNEKKTNTCFMNTSIRQMNKSSKVMIYSFSGPIYTFSKGKVIYMLANHIMQLKMCEDHYLWQQIDSNLKPDSKTYLVSDLGKFVNLFLLFVIL